MQNEENVNPPAPSSQISNISTTVNENLLFVKSQLGEGIGLSEGRFKAFSGYIEIGVVFIRSLCDKELINAHIIPTLLHGTLNDTTIITDIAILAQALYISSVNTKKAEQLEAVIVELLQGNAVIFFDNCSSALIVESRKVDKRSIDKPENEIAIFAAKEAFVEDIDTNTGMIIKRLPIPTLKVHSFTVGVLSQTNSKLLWLDGVSKDSIINEVKSRLKNITTNMIDNTSTIAKLIQDKPTSIFPTYRLTERPDLASKVLSDGYFVILCNNSPFALIGPMNFWDSFKTMYDYAELTFASSLLRFIRLMAFLISIIISPLYLAFVTYNHTIVPPSLALNISQGREGVPFPSIIELIGMTIIIDIIREAGTRMPGIVGYFIGTLGAVIIGQAAVAAGYVSVSLIIVVAFSAIASFAISSTALVNTSRLINYFLILLAGLLGIFGFFNGSFIILWRMSIMESFGVPYLYPVDRTPSLRNSVSIIIVPGKAEGVIATRDPNAVTSSGKKIRMLLNSAKSNGGTYSVTLHDFLQMMTRQGVEPVAPRIITTPLMDDPGEALGGSQNGVRFAVEKQGNLMASGMAAFKENQFVGWLNAKETLGLNWILGNKITSYKTSNIDEPSSNNDMQNLPLHSDLKKMLYFFITKSKSKVKVKIENDKPVVYLDVKIEAALRKYYSDEGSEYIAADIVNSIEEKLERSINSDITAALKKGKDELDSDIFGFGFNFYRQHPKEWHKSYEKSWDSIFKNISIKVNVEAKLNNTGTNIKKFFTK